MADQDFLMQAALGALEGFNSAYVPYKRLEAQELFAEKRDARRREADMTAMRQKQAGEFDTFQKELPLKESSEIRVNNAKPLPTYVVNPAPGELLPGQRPFNLPKPAIDPMDKLDAKKKSLQPKAKLSLNQLTSSLDKEIALAKSIKDNPALPRVTGVSGKLPNLPGGEAANLQAKIDQLKAATFISEFQSMKQNSPNGSSGLGAASDIEGQKVEKKGFRGDQKQSSKEFQKAVDERIAVLEDTKRNLQRAYEEDYGLSTPGVETGGNDPLGLGF